MDPISITETYPVPSDEVWTAITDPKQMKKWYFDVPMFKPEIGNRFEFKGVDTQGKEWIHECVVKTVSRNQKLGHTWTYKGQKGESLVEWLLKAKGEKTEVTLVHSGIESFPANPAFARENFVRGWTEILKTALRMHLENEHQ